MPSERSKSAEEVPADLLPVIKKSGVLSERAFEDLRSKVLAGDYPNDSRALAQRLVRERVLTEYQVKRLLSNKPHGLTVGKYIILDRLGSGSMGRVYKAQHQLMGRTVALKIIAPEIVSNARVVARFQREMRMVGRLDHPNVVRAYDADQLGGILYIVMEYVPGQSLGQKFRATGPLPAIDVINYAAQAALGLAHAHDQGIVHRDVKPSNLLVNDEHILKVLDLGLGVLLEADEQSSFATADGIAVGTIDYMSPEQAMGKEVDGRSDIYSLGCSMYHMITGKLPFPGESPVDRLAKRITGRPVPITDHRPDLPQAFVRVLDKMLAAKPQERYQTATEAAEALQGLVRKKSAAATQRKNEVESRPAPQAAVPQVETKVVQVRPSYPRWFRPLAEIAEKSPAAAAGALVGGLLASFGLGFVVRMLVD